MAPILIGVWSFLKAIPKEIYYILVAIALIIGFALYFDHRGAARVQAEWDADVARIKEETKRILELKELEYTKLQEKYSRENLEITEKFNAEIKRIKSRPSTSGLLLGPSFSCRDSTTTVTESPKSSDGASETRRVLPERVAKDFDKLIEDMEHDAAVARACQSFVINNKLVGE